MNRESFIGKIRNEFVSAVTVRNVFFLNITVPCSHKAGPDILVCVSQHVLDFLNYKSNDFDI